MRQKDQTPHTCQLCNIIFKASAMNSHLFHKHKGWNCDSYAQKFGEFRRKQLTEIKLRQEGNVVCKECNIPLKTHKHLLHHIHTHNMTWQDYFIKHIFGGKWPTCQCGCGERVQLLRHGKNHDKNGIEAYSRAYVLGHTPANSHEPGYRKNTPEQKETMRKAAINRLKRDGHYFDHGPSKPERELAAYIQSLGVDNMITSDKNILAGHELDVYIPDMNIAFEFNGTYFHSDLYKKKDYHLKKTLECAAKGIRLIHIWEPDWLKNQNVMKSVIENILGKCPTKVYARKCEIKEIDYETCSKFLNDNHLQGACVNKIRVGLFYENELVAVMAFSSLRKALGNTSKEGSYELIRFCSKLHTQIIGGASRLFKWFINTHSPKYILTYANRDWSLGSMYENLGMKKEGYTTPGYFYVKSRIKYNRFQFMKHLLVAKGADKNKTEYEIMMEDGYMRIWDTGNIKYTWTADVPVLEKEEVDSYL